MNDIITHENFLDFCSDHYDNPQCHNVEEFNDDLMRLKYIKKLVTRYCESGELKERLILNHIIVLNNVFGPQSLCKILWLKMSEQLPYIKPFLIFLNILPDKIHNVGDMNIIDTTLVGMDPGIINALRKI